MAFLFDERCQFVQISDVHPASRVTQQMKGAVYQKGGTEELSGEVSDQTMPAASVVARKFLTCKRQRLKLLG